MRDALRRILKEDWIVVFGSGIALGYMLLTLGEAVGAVVVTGLESQSVEQLFASDASPLSFAVGDHVIELGGIVRSLGQLGVVLLVVAFAVSRLQRAPDAEP